ncbi:adenine phosphoribosyltransferase [mine drainage metagenome]|uniref:Adenine phosphoribosyltransferase n=1 Tax=mine drainage metagenome TaxID=410659 RepID=T1CKJ6_9ZZZZ
MTQFRPNPCTVPLWIPLTCKRCAPRSAAFRTTQSPGFCFGTSPRCSATRRCSNSAVAELSRPWADRQIGHVAGIEARGFILGGAVAHRVGAGFIPIRKKGKLPHETVRVAYSLEYGLDEMEMHRDAIEPENRFS